MQQPEINTLHGWSIFQNINGVYLHGHKGNLISPSNTITSHYIDSFNFIHGAFVDQNGHFFTLQEGSNQPTVTQEQCELLNDIIQKSPEPKQAVPLEMPDDVREELERRSNELKGFNAEFNPE